MRKKNVSCIAFIEKDRSNPHHLILTKNEFHRALRRFSHSVEIVRREEIKKKLALTRDNGRGYV